MLCPIVKSEVAKKLEQYEGRFNHLYLDTKGHVTIGIGHLIPHRNAIAVLPLYKLNNSFPGPAANLIEKQSEYDQISKLPYGQRYGASSFKPYCQLVMKDSDIDAQRNQHIKTFHFELKRIYTRSNGFIHDFDEFHKNAQLALFDMIFNLGATKLTNVFQKFNRAVRVGDWRQAAIESHRVDVNAARNQYVRLLLNNVPATQPAV